MESPLTRATWQRSKNNVCPSPSYAGLQVEYGTDKTHSEHHMPMQTSKSSQSWTQLDGIPLAHP